jgi:hypothetical protein
MADQFYKPSKNKNYTTVRIIGPEPAWLAEIHQEQRLMAKLKEKGEMFKLAQKAQEG